MQLADHMRSTLADVYPDLPPTRVEDLLVVVLPIGCSMREWPSGTLIDRKHLDYICEVPSACADGTEDRSDYLTFDDGPNSFFTPQILDVLAEHRVPATFFVIGAYAAEQPDLIPFL
ncbi:Polysaccharide deacetylase [Mesorhizobium albiziae]|uniref:Chitooligosaccharide deacetylase n=1 Tax=Neomesorhizobium albiziae TaxID=335020 RepID=A0A1I3ZQY5_9HYPH|nr:hypothetical protein GCM10007937_40130 [Mesorhizobium albiziae]SFK46081.1 Polysaccharide deacetylase [Mesorhizobium albiziae]